MSNKNNKPAIASLGGGILSRVQKAWGAGSLHHARMAGPAPDRLYLQPDYPRSPDRTIGQALVRGRMMVGAQSCDVGENLSMLWAKLPGDGALFAYGHGYEWLNALASLAREDPPSGAASGAAQAAHILFESWLDAHEKWSPDVWRPRLVAERLTHWCCHGDLILKQGDALWRSRLLTAMARQARHLAQSAHKAPAGTDALMTAMGLCLAGLCLPACDVARERGQELMRRELRLQVRSDGGHISRNPSIQLELVIRLQMIAKAYEHRGLALPGHVRLALGRAIAMVQFFRCPDGALALFNGGYEDDTDAIIAACAGIDDAIPFGFARYTQYQRLSAARALVVVDVGADKNDSRTGLAPAAGFDGAGAFHLSSGRTRLIGNCGNGDHLGGEWPKALRQAAAHSTLSFSGSLSHKGLFSGETLHQRAEEVSGILLEITRPFALKAAPSEGLAPGAEPPAWHRRLFLAAGGDDLRGEERLIGLPERFAKAWRIRFHLHPEIKASVARDEQSVILALPNQEGWRFRTNFRGVRLENSIYCGEGGQPAASEQIVLGADSAALGMDMGDCHDIIIKWAFKRLDGI